MKEKIKVPTGPDVINGGDGLPDWMQFTVTLGMFGLLTWILYLLFHPTLSLDETHRDLFKQVTDFYNENDELLRQVEREWHAGTDQTPVNFLIHDKNVDFKWLPYEYNMCDMVRKEALTEDMLFTKWGWIYQYNSIPNNHEDKLTLHWMKKTYEYLYG